MIGGLHGMQGVSIFSLKQGIIQGEREEQLWI